MQCRSCGDEVDQLRVELGYDYCLKEECQRQCLKPVTLASVGVNKAADYYTTPDELFPPPPPSPPRSRPDDDSEREPERKERQRSRTPDGSRPLTTGARLHQLEQRLDDELAKAYGMFQRGEITAREMERTCDDLIAGFNQRVMGENIRFRSMMRPRRNRGR